jgi:RimJ/RimL family protein N-acetyltransferase
MPENKSVILHTERLILRDFKKDDWQAAHEYGSDPETVKYMPFGPNTEQDTKNFVSQVLASQKAQPRLNYDLALISKAENKLMGSCRIQITSIEHQEAEIGYVLNRRYWNQGFITEAVRRIISFGFEQLGLHRIYATCDPANTGSYRVIGKAGMQREGCLRQKKTI